ncbi:hypothetical protein PIB30_024356 [Stylosanthes scabra]|uniref:Uncharacterized protein n=1 Tax=Stylosanthes scabra TaxID=79078 RepID=A0ABU6Q9Y9_9FABA|nr:hypothetical protein [Stylosanthes scabra]
MREKERGESGVLVSDESGKHGEYSGLAEGGNKGESDGVGVSGVLGGSTEVSGEDPNGGGVHVPGKGVQHGPVLTAKVSFRDKVVGSKVAKAFELAKTLSGKSVATVVEGVG